MKILSAGDRAVTVDFGNVISEEINLEVTTLAAKMQRRNEPGIEELVPTYRSLLVRFDPILISRAALIKMIENVTKENTEKKQEEKRRIHIIPCCYGGPFGEDLEGLSQVTRRSTRDIIRMHSKTDYLIYMMGFLPGFVYLGGMDPRIAAPRLESPRVEIPAGSVGIGGSQTGIYPVASPGGWRLIGKTPVPLFCPKAEHPMLCTAGEYIRFEPIREDEFYMIERDLAAGTYQSEVIE